MDVFSLRDAVVGEYKQFATSFTTIYAEDIRTQIDAIYANDRYWPEPLIQINPNFAPGEPVDALVAKGVLHPTCAEIFRADGAPLKLHLHQKEAISIAAMGESYVVTTGTGSGKSLCFFIPIVDRILRQKAAGEGKRTRAIIIYPMNALANSQEEELKKYLGNVKGAAPVTFARYTGQDDQEKRQAVAADPPDILLTNFMMLELLMTRQDDLDRKVIGNCEGLDFLVLDELHTYRGRQGADVALLVRRVRERLSAEKLLCVGTSATMASGGSIDDKKRVVAEVAEKLFATKVDASNVVVETLKRRTDESQTEETILPALGKAVDAPIAEDISDAALRVHPLAVWVETKLGVESKEGRWERAKPLTVKQAAAKLAQDAKRDEGTCREALRRFLLVSSLAEAKRTGKEGASQKSFFAFKLHQFLSGAGHAFATLEAPGKRRVTVEGQVFLPGEMERRLYPVHFCRECGHEYHPVRLVAENGLRKFHARDIDDSPLPKPDDAESAAVDDDEADAPQDSEQYGFLTLDPADGDFEFAGDFEDYPESWTETSAKGDLRLKANFRPSEVQEVRVEPDGKEGTGLRAWFLPGKFRFCLRCRDLQSSSARDRNRLASLSAEGRSSATTVLVASALRWMHGGRSGMAEETRKLLGFTDNRQDAALQAGHFNDFLFVSLIRAGFLSALELAGHGGIRAEQLGEAQQRALGFLDDNAPLRREWMRDPTLKGGAIGEAGRTLREVLAYRVWFDQRRGWRYTNPNLEQLKLVEVEYEYLEKLAADEAEFAAAPDILKRAKPEVRVAVYRKLFDHLRQWMAIRSQLLSATNVEQLRQQSFNRLRPPWGLSEEQLRPGRWLMVDAPLQRKNRARDEELIVRGGSRSALGRILKNSKLWGGAPIRKLNSKEFDELVTAMLRAASRYELVVEEPTPWDDQKGWRLVDTYVRFKRAVPPASDGKRANRNAYFIALYRALADLLAKPGHPLFGFEAREHTAQVEKETREVREQRFRWGAKEQAELASDEGKALLKDLGEPGRFLPVLFCSPTMELGVDISALNAVYLRNVPPTPANYAQRSGRAGRSGQAALVLAYAAAQSPHDQFFFERPREMVHGEVRAPLIELANRDLVESHLHAIWLACTKQPLERSIAELLRIDLPGRPLREDLREALLRPDVAKEASERIGRVLARLEDDLQGREARWYEGRDQLTAKVVSEAPDRFAAAFERWRALLGAAEEQRDAARRIADSHAAQPADRKAAERREAQAYAQIALLKKGDSSASSDFYTYRYLATEGFLPGYNFPRLPLMAYVPGVEGGGRQAFLQRPRFLALSEFGPRSLVYHEGRAYRVVRAMLALGKESATPEARLPTKTVRICGECGAGHFNLDRNTCHGCGTPLGDAEVVKEVFRIDNVATQPAERITANEEERQRQGFELQTTFEWATRDGAPDFLPGGVNDEDGVVLRVAYGNGAKITRLNKGLRRRANKKVLGFRIDPVTGYWAKNADEEDDRIPDPTAIAKQRIVPCVDDYKNALLVRPAEADLSETTLATLQYALLRGIEVRFQLEEGEILAEPMPTRAERKGFLLYEATEGGAGVLSRIVEEAEIIQEIALFSLGVMHFDVEKGLPVAETGLQDRPDTSCVAACYRCLMSYFNQPDHELLDRRDAKAREILLRLARASTTLEELEDDAPAARVVAPGASLEEQSLASWHVTAKARGIPRPDASPLRLDGVEIPLVWREHYVAAAFDPVPDAVADQLADKGIALVTFDVLEKTWGRSFEELSKALGHS